MQINFKQFDQQCLTLEDTKLLGRVRCSKLGYDNQWLVQKLDLNMKVIEAT